MRKTRTLEKVPYPAPDVVTKVVPAPTEGWDAISPLADMSPQRAPILDNWVPRPGFIEVRKGSRVWVTSTLSSQIESLMVYEQPSVVTMYAATQGGSILNVTSSATTATVVATVYSTGRWEYTNFTPAGAATVMMFVNGTDNPQMVAGTVSVFATVTVSDLTIVSSTLLAANFSNIAAVKRRLWFVIENSTKAVFMPTDAIAGPIAGYLDLGALWKKGGYLVAIGNWTIDGGAGPDDYTVFISSQGQISVYQGTDPTNSSWTLKGTFDVAHPIGKRCLYRFGSDLLIITHQGILPISQVLPFDPSADRSTAVTQRIQNAMTRAVAQYEANFGWELIAYPEQTLLFLNVPADNGGTFMQQQFVMNTLTGAWCRFTGWSANTFAMFNNNLYFGDTSGNIQQAYKGLSDNGSLISADLQCAFNWYETPGRLKRITFLQPLMNITGQQMTPSFGVDADFSSNAITGSSQTVNNGSVWGTAVWGTGVWGGDFTYTPWLTVTAFGKALAIRVQLSYAGSTDDNSTNLTLNAFNTVVELGGMV